MNTLRQYKRGDIAIFMTIIISTIMFTLLVAISQKVALESRLIRENLSSQQAVQAANTGLDAWQYALRTGSIDIRQPGNNANLPNQPNEWIILSNQDNRLIEYRVEYSDSGGVQSIISTGKVTQAGRSIERRLELTFN